MPTLEQKAEPVSFVAPATSAPAARSTPATERIFYGGGAALVAACVFAGFWRSYLLRGVVGAPFFPVSPLSARIHIHAAVFLGWIALFIAQTSLVGAGRRDMHRKLGLIASVWVPVLVGVGLWMALASPDPGLMEPRGWLLVSAADLLVFAVLAVAGLLQRRDLQTHKRLMLLATISLLPASIGRWPLPGAAWVIGIPASFFAAADLALLPLMAWDWLTRGRIHRATLWGGAWMVLSLPARFALAGTATWLAAAERLQAWVR